MSIAAKRDNDAASVLPLADEAILWKATKDGNVAARERVIETYLPYARILAAKLYAGRIDSDLEFAEYQQFATVGLIEAVDRFDPDRDIQFKTFASQRIQGSVLNGIEHLSEKRVQISARKQLQVDRRASGKAALEQPDKDVFQQLSEVAIGLALGYLLDAPSEPRDHRINVPENQYSGLELRQLQERIRALVERLPQREKMVIKYHYLNHMPFHLIAETMSLSRGRISQIHRHGLALLHEAVKSVKACDMAW